MYDLISLIANLVAIATGMFGYFSKANKSKWLGVALAMAIIGLVVFVCGSRPSAIVVTTLEKYDSGFYSGTQDHYAQYPIAFLSPEVSIEYKTRGGSKGNSPSSYENYLISSGSELERIDSQSSIERTLSRLNDTEVFYRTKFFNSMDVSQSGLDWHQPKGWAGFNYNTNKILFAKELIIVLDFSKIPGQHPISKPSPRFKIVPVIDPKPDEIKLSGEQMMQNDFIEMKVLGNSQYRIYYAKIKNPPQGRVLVRWKVNQ